MAGKHKPGLRKITIYLPEELSEEIENAANREALQPGNVSAYVRRVVTEALEDQPPAN